MKFPHLHDWDVWSEPINTMNSEVKVQVRYCAICNKCQASKIKQPWNVWFAWTRSKEKP
jgi:hypothetical protein